MRRFLVASFFYCAVGCVAKLKEAVYVVHCFQKKTQKTARKDIDLSNKRLRELMQGQIL